MIVIRALIAAVRTPVLRILISASRRRRRRRRGILIWGWRRWRWLCKCRRRRRMERSIRSHEWISELNRNTKDPKSHPQLTKSYSYTRIRNKTLELEIRGKLKLTAKQNFLIQLKRISIKGNPKNNKLIEIQEPSPFSFKIDNLSNREVKIGKKGSNFRDSGKEI